MFERAKLFFEVAVIYRPKLCGGHTCSTAYTTTQRHLRERSLPPSAQRRCRGQSESPSESPSPPLAVIKFLIIIIIRMVSRRCSRYFVSPESERPLDQHTSF